MNGKYGKCFHNSGTKKKEVSGMISFLLCLAILIVGYFVYGKIVETPSARTTAKRLLCASTTVWTML